MQRKGVTKCLVVLNFRDRLMPCMIFTITPCPACCVPIAQGPSRGFLGPAVSKLGQMRSILVTVCLSLHLEGLVRFPQHFNVLKEYQKLHFKNDPNLMIGSIGQGFILGLFNDSIHPKQPRCKVLAMTMRANMAEGRPMTMLGSTTTQVRIAQCSGLLGCVYGP